jgi:hypothetical protein
MVPITVLDPNESGKTFEHEDSVSTNMKLVDKGQEIIA